MGSPMTFGQKRFIPTPPDKGSFPLDHEGSCKRLMLQYMSCLREYRDDNSKCRDQTKAYLQCRMDHNLMAKEEWSKLGFSDVSKSTTSTTDINTNNIDLKK